MEYGHYKSIFPILLLKLVEFLNNAVKIDAHRNLGS